MSIRKRTWIGTNGEEKAAWLVDYRDSSGVRRNKQFGKKKDAEAWLTKAAWEVTQGTHTPESQSITIARAADLWLAQAREDNLEPTTVASYEQHVRLHIKPLCGEWKLSKLDSGKANQIRSDLRSKLSPPMAKRVMRSLSSIVDEAQHLQYVNRNVFADLIARKRKRQKQANREKPKVVIPSKSDLRAMIEATHSSDPMDEALFLVSIFCGLRASETRGMTWPQIDLRAGTLLVDRRADAGNVIGPPKSESGNRIIPLPAIAIAALRKWKLRCPKSTPDLVFPSLAGKVMSHRSLHMLHLWPVQMAAGVSQPCLNRQGEPIFDKDGAPVRKARYASHALRHCAASLWIEQRVSPKKIQRWMGHYSIQVTFDTYGHLFEQAEADSSIAEAVVREVMGNGLPA